MDSEHPPEMTQSQVRSPPLTSVTPGPPSSDVTAPAATSSYPP